MRRHNRSAAWALLILGGPLLWGCATNAAGGGSGTQAGIELKAAIERTVAAQSIRAESQSIVEGSVVTPIVQIFQAPDRVKTLQSPGRPGSEKPSHAVRVGDVTYVSADQPGTYYRSADAAGLADQPAFPGGVDLKLVLAADAVSRDGERFLFSYQLPLVDVTAEVRGEVQVENGYLKTVHLETTAGERHSDTVTRYSSVNSAPPVEVPPESAVVPAPPGVSFCEDGLPAAVSLRCPTSAAVGSPLELPLVVDPAR